MEVTKWLKPSISVSRIGDSASVQAGKGPQFKIDAIRGEGPGDWETYQLQKTVQKLQMALHAKA
jgi:hypothetical protein